MTCSPAHRRWCSADHAQLVGDYRDQRDARDALRESAETVPAAFAFGGDVAYYQLEDDDFNAAVPVVTFKDWLIYRAGRNRNPDNE